MGNSRILSTQSSAVDVMQPMLRKVPFSGEGWLFEPKWDGYWAVCYLVEGTVRFVSRNKRSSFASISPSAPKKQPSASKIKKTDLSREKIAADTLKKPRRLRFHSLPLVIRRGAFRFIPGRKGGLQIGMVGKVFSLAHAVS